MKQILSEQFSLNFRDFVQGAVLAIIAAVVPLVQATLEAGSFTFNWTAIGLTAASTFVAYIVRSFLRTTRVIEVNPSESKVEALKTAGK